MRATNSLVQEKEKFTTAITGNNLQTLIRKSVPDAKSAARLTGTLIATVAASEQLQACSPASIVASALKGEGMGLICGIGYYLVPYGSTCTFVPGYKGLLQLAIASGDLADIDVVEVREGEIVGRDAKKKKPIFDFSVYKTDEEAAAHPIIGYMVYAEKKDGFYRSEYWTINELLEHGFRYSAAFKREKYEKLVSGQCSEDEIEKLKKSSPWYDIGGNQVTMFKKTCLRSILNSGYLSLANDATIRDAITGDGAYSEDVLPGFDITPEVSVVESTGEVVEETAQNDTETASVMRRERKASKHTAETENVAQAQEMAQDDFFGEG